MPLPLDPNYGIALIGAFFNEWWWLILPPFLYFLFREIWHYHLEKKTVLKWKWVTLSLQVPREIIKTPKAMEQIFAGLHASTVGINWIEKHITGKVQEWMCFELVGIGNKGVFFYVTLPQQLRNLVESQIYAQYPQVEISEAEDYTHFLPPRLPDKNYNLWGTEYYLKKESCYPLRMYSYFEEIKDEKRVDPLANLFEWFSRLKDGEQIWIQMHIRPADDEWKKEGDRIIAKLAGKPEKPKAKSSSQGLMEFLRNLLLGFFQEPIWGEEKKGDALPSRAQFLTPGEKDIVQCIEEKIAKIGFHSGIRVIYTAKKELFSKANVPPINAFFRQFNTQNLNALKSNSKVATSIDFWFKQGRELYRKARIYRRYREREFPTVYSVLNIEELASIYHFPIKEVEAPNLGRIGSYKSAPPPNLPIA